MLADTLSKSGTKSRFAKTRLCRCCRTAGATNLSEILIDEDVSHGVVCAQLTHTILFILLFEVSIFLFDLKVSVVALFFLDYLNVGLESRLGGLDQGPELVLLLLVLLLLQLCELIGISKGLTCFFLEKLAMLGIMRGQGLLYFYQAICPLAVTDLAFFPV